MRVPILTSLTRQVLSTLAVAAFVVSACAAEDPAPQKKPEFLPRLLAKLEAEPLIALCSEDLRALPEKFTQTHFNKMLQDPSYVKGRDFLRALINHHFGADIAALWPDFKDQLSGPAALAILPNAKKEAGDPDFRLVLAVLTPTDESAKKLLLNWPKVPPQSSSILSALRLVPIVEKDLPAENTVQAWAKSDAWPKGELSLRILPRKLGQTLRPWIEQGEGDGLEFIALWLSAIRDRDVERLGVGISATGETFNEELQLELNADSKSAFSHVLETVRENPSPWDAVLAATPGDDDLILLSQSNFSALDSDLPFATQALERYLRGKRWTKTRGRQPEALDPLRFDLLKQHAQGTFAMVAKPTASGDLRLTVVTAVKNDGAGAIDVEALRADVAKLLTKVGAEFDTLQNARKIGNVAPLGATFQGRGLFTTPVIGFSPGWAWICSSTAAYQDLTAAFKSGRTLANEMARQPANGAAGPRGKPDHWRAGDALRLQIDLEKILKLAYAAWLLSGAEGPFIGPWKVPGDLLPQPGIFTARLGTLRTGLGREGKKLTVYSSSSLPFSSFVLPAMLEEAADTIENTHKDTTTILENEKALREDDDKPDKPVTKAPTEERKN